MRLNSEDDREVHNGTKEEQVAGQSQESLPTQEKLSLASWGLPEKVLQHYHQKGITEMFPWQLDCLTVGKVLEGGNLVYSAPTSAGKTLVAEILISQTIFERQKKVILILPFVSVVREKMFYFQSLFSLNGIKVEGYMGGHCPSAAFQQVHMAVCTIEKANSIINRLLEEHTLNCLGLVVVDELHLLGDPYRGYLLELLLTKLKYMTSKSEKNIQIVGMSATLPNLKVLADWLKADLYYTTFRPIPLSEMIKCENALYDKKMNKIEDIIPYESEIPDVVDHIGQLCVETIKSGHSVLIFCPAKAWCENLADEIALFFMRHGCSKSAVIEGTPGFHLRKFVNLQKLNQVIEHLRMTPVGVDKDLQRTISYGVAFHHAGLTLDERDIVEGSFRNGSIKVLCATSTLSSGVNLPARRVIIRSPMAFGSVIDTLTYKQMIGRAGRMGIDSEGESILICKPNEKSICQQLMTSKLKPIESCLGRGPLSSSLKRALLEIVASGIACTPQEVQEYASCTFLASSSKHNIENPIDSCIKFLEENEFIRLQENGTIYAATPLGNACLASSMPPDEGLSLFRELQRARRSFVLDTDLHIIYQVTPYNVSEQWNKLDWLHVLSIFEGLPESMKRVGSMVGIEEAFLVRIVKGVVNLNIMENKVKLSIHRRFYTALALQDLVNEMPLVEVAEKYQCNKGTLQSLQQSAATYAGMVTEFTSRLGWGSVELIFSQFQQRLQFGVQKDLCELMRLPLLNVIRARALHKAGYTNLVSLANANPCDLENLLYSITPFQSKKEIAGETSFEKDERNKLQTIWITGKADVSVRKAAELLIEEARNALELELGVKGAKWCSESSQAEISNDSKTLIGDLTSSENGISTDASNETYRADGSAVEGDASVMEFKTQNLSINNAWYNEQNEYDLTYNVSTKKGMTDKTLAREGSFGLGCNEATLPVAPNSLLEFSSASLKKQSIVDYFATSLNMENLTNLCKQEDEDNISKVDESECSSSCSEQSVEVMYETQQRNERLSGDMFFIPETEKLNDKTGETKVEDKVPDLFSQSLTFDTQLQQVLDDNFQSKMKRATSFTSDDLGFVSDASPPKLNQIPKVNRIAIIKPVIDSPMFTSSPFEVKLKEVLNKHRSEAVKRKAYVGNSPDFIIGSDDSLVEDRHHSKRAKMEVPKSGSIVTETPPHEMDDEIMPTPKPVKSNVSSKLLSNLNGKKRSTNRGSSSEIRDCSSVNSIRKTLQSSKLNTTYTKRQPEKSNRLNTTRKNLSSLSSKVNLDKINILDVPVSDDIFESFWEELKLRNIVGLAFGCRRVVRERKSSIGLKIMKKKSDKPKGEKPIFQFDDLVLDGIAFYWAGNDVYYLSFDGGGKDKASIIGLMKEISTQGKCFRLFDAKEQIKVFHRFTTVLLEESYQDPKIAHWLLSKTWKEKSFSAVVLEYIPEASKLTSELGPLLGFSGPGSCITSSVSTRTRTCIEAFLSFHVTERQLRLMKSKALLRLFDEIEMPLTLSLVEMELVGFQFDKLKLLEVKSRLDTIQSELSDKAHSFANSKFALNSPAAIRKVLFSDLKLAGSNTPLTKKNRRLSTKKEVLQDLAIETNHPLPDIILNWRKVQSVLSKVISPLLQTESEATRLYSTTQLFTVTGRLALHEPNLQNMPRNFSVNFAKDEFAISIRDVFVPSDNCTLLSVDFSQIELRLLAHLSEDENLIATINNSDDIFLNIASQIYGIPKSSIDDELRQKAKQTCYGIIYGIGSRGLSSALRVEEPVAVELMNDFKNRYKGVNQYLDSTVKECRKKGFVSSLFGRRRYLPYINDSNPSVKSEAERQAINTAIQGSAADLMKIALVKIRRNIKELKEENMVSNLVLHLHDELLFEVNHDHVEVLAGLLKETMENAVSLRVRTPVKFRVGPSWGQLSGLNIEGVSDFYT